MAPLPPPPPGPDRHGDDLAALQRGQTRWATRSFADRVELLAECQRTLAAHAGAWVAASCAAKLATGLPHVIAEEWASGPLPVARHLSLLRSMHADLAQGRLPSLPGPAKSIRDGAIVPALPIATLRDRWLLRGHTAQVRVGPGPLQREPSRDGGVRLVLGAGNVTSMPIGDALHAIFQQGASVLLKLSPLHRDLLPEFARALAPLLGADLLRLCVGDGALGQSLARRQEFAAVHLTGAPSTWQLLRTDPALRGKELSAEVGNVTPVLVVPGRWPLRALLAAARQLAAWIGSNAGCTCVAPRVVLLAAEWPQRTWFVQRVQQELQALPGRPPFYPDAALRWARATGSPPPDGPLPPRLQLANAPADQLPQLREEIFAPVATAVTLPGADAGAFLANAVRFVNDHVFGRLAAVVLGPDRVLARAPQPVARTLDELPHGTVALNAWPAIGYALGTTPWGVPDGAPVATGRGFVHGTLCLVAPRKVVLRGPLSGWPPPPWLPWHRRGAPALAALTQFYLAPSLARLLPVAAAALRP